MKKAFTLIELIVVIVILGITVMIGTDIIAHMYEAYLKTKYTNDLSQKTELALNQISSRLQYRIKDSVLARKKSTTGYLLNNDVIPMSIYNSQADFVSLEWIGYDNEGFLGMWDDTKAKNTPGWSGFIDLYSPDTNKTQIKTSGSRLDFANQIIDSLSNGDINLSVSDSIILIPHNSLGDVLEYYSSSNNNKKYIVTKDSSSNDILIFNNDLNKTIKEHYRLSWSAYALVPQYNSDGDFNLTLRYNYRPWANSGKTNISNANNSLLIENVKSFKFLEENRTIYLKLCIDDDNLSGSDFGFCKEKAIF